MQGSESDVMSRRYEVRPTQGAASADLAWLGMVGGGFLVVTLAAAFASMLGLSSLAGSESRWVSQAVQETGLAGGSVAGPRLLLGLSAGVWTSHVAAAEALADAAQATLPLSVLALVCAAVLSAVVRTASRAVPALTTAHLWARVAGAAVAMTLLLSVLGAIGRVPTDEGAVVTFVSLPSALRAGLLLAVATAICSLLALPHGSRAQLALGRHGARAGSLADAVGAAGWHVLSWLVVSFVAGAVLLATKGQLPLPLAVNWAGAGALAVPVLAHLGSYELDIAGIPFLQSGSTDLSISVLDPRLPALAWGLPLLAIALLVAAAARLAARRGPVQGFDPIRALTTAAVFAAGWLAVWIAFGTVSVRMIAPLSVDASVRPTPLGMLLLLLVGALVEVVAVVAGPVLLSAAPGLVSVLAGGRVHPGWYGRPVPVGPVPTGPGYLNEREGVEPEDESNWAAADSTSPLLSRLSTAARSRSTAPIPVVAAPAAVLGDPAARRRSVLLTLLAGAVVTVLLLGWGVVSAADRRFNGPQAVAGDFLAALVAGDAKGAVAMGHVSVPTSQRLLLTDAVYGGGDARPSSGRVLSTTVAGDTATVLTEVGLDGATEELTLTLRRTSQTAGLWSRWEIEPVELSTLTISPGASTVLVNGAEVDLTQLLDQQKESVFSTGISLPALPGVYTVGYPTGDPWYTSESRGATVGFARSATVTMEATLTDKFYDEVDAQLRSVTDECVRDYRADTCPFKDPASGYLAGSLGRVTVAEYPRANRQSPSWQPGARHVIEVHSGTLETSGTVSDFLGTRASRDERTIAGTSWDGSGWRATIGPDGVQVSYEGG